MLKIAHIDTGHDLGGGQWQLLLLARRLRERGHEQWIVCRRGSALEGRARQEGFRVVCLPTRDPAGVRGALALRGLAKVQQLNIVHAHDGRGQTIAGLASLRPRVRRVASRRVTFLPRWRTLHRLKYQHTCDRVIAVSNCVRDLLVGCGVPAAMIAVIYDGIEIPEHLPDAEARAATRQKWGCTDQDFVIGNMGAFRRGKGYEVAMRAANFMETILRRGEAKWQFGVDPKSPEESSRFPLLIGGRNFRPVRLPDDPSEYLNALDLYVVPSLAEGLGSSALLAMAHGVPVAASRAGGLPEIVLEGRTGWLFTPGRAEELARVVAHVMENRDELKQFGANARRHASEFSDVIMAARTEDLYMKLRDSVD